MPDVPSKPTLQQQDLRWLACPVCRQALVIEADLIRCSGCRRAYPIVDGIPILLANRTS